MVKGAGAIGKGVAKIAGKGAILGAKATKSAKPAEVEGQISGYVGSGYEGRVRFQFEDPSNRPSWVWFRGPSPIDDSGKLTAKAQQPGERILALYLKSGRNGWTPLADLSVSLRSGKQSVAIAMPALHSLRVVWTGDGKPKLGLKLVHKKGARAWHSANRQIKVGKDGVATFDGLVAGQYSVVVYGAWKGPRPVVDVPAQSEIRIP